MERPALEVADIFRDFGPAWLEANRRHVSHAQLKVMDAILACRTAALGGFVARCENPDCAHTDISYCSCLMGKIGNGESARACHLLDRLFHVFHRGYAYVLLPISQMFTGGRPTVIWSPIAKSQGAQCWRDILRHRRCSGTYARDRADNTLMGLLRRSTRTDTVQLLPCAIFARPLTSAMFFRSKAGP